MPAPVSPALYDQFARGWRGYLLIALIALCAAIPGAGKVPVLDRGEAEVAVATRQATETGRPAGGAPAIHWLQEAAVHALKPDRSNDVWPYRAPSMLGLMLAALATLWGGTALVGQRPAFIGAGLLAAGMLAGFEGMVAQADAVLLGLTTLAVAALARLRSAPDKGRTAYALVFWLALALGALVKGPITPLVAGLTLATLAIWERRAAWMKPLAFWPGPLLALAIAAPFVTQLDFNAFALDASHLALPGYHLVLLSFLIFPATYALPGAARLVLDTVRTTKSDEEHAPMRFLIAWAVPTFILFELSPTKLAHLVLPTYPAIALICGLGLMATARHRWRASHPAGVVLYAVAGAVIVTAMAVATTFMPGDLSADVRRAISAALLGAVIVGGGVAGLIILRRPTARLAVLVLSALAISYSLREHILPDARGLFPSSETVVALTRARLLPTDKRPLWVVGYREPSLVFETRSSIRRADADEAGARAQIGDAMVVRGSELTATTAALAVRHLQFAQKSEPVRGLNLGDGQRVVLFVGSVEAEAPSDVSADGRTPRP